MAAHLSIRPQQWRLAGSGRGSSKRQRLRQRSAREQVPHHAGGLYQDARLADSPMRPRRDAPAGRAGVTGAARHSSGLQRGRVQRVDRGQLKSWAHELVS